MDRGAWRVTVHRVAELDTTEVTACMHVPRVGALLDPFYRCGNGSRQNSKAYPSVPARLCLFNQMIV